VGIDDAGCADADPEEWRPGIGAQSVDELKDEVDSRFAVTAFERQARRPQDLATQVDDGAAELRLAEVEADQRAAFRGDTEQDR
jgi:hypothetical protein